MGCAHFDIPAVLCQIYLVYESELRKVDPNQTKILIIEVKHSENPAFSKGLEGKGYNTVTVPNGSAALEKISADFPDLVVLNAATLRTSGRRICQNIRAKAEKLPIILILAGDQEPFEPIDGCLVLPLPFTLQKLLNRIRPLLPVDSKDVLRLGHLQVDTKQRMARYLDKQARLTPRLLKLLTVFMEHPGVVIERKVLFSQVWETEYTADMRSLDVHVSWLRQALEDDPRHPRIFKTIRGLGYRLDIGEPPTRPLRKIRS
jgi:DNA-binding response OmpR family regulator